MTELLAIKSDFSRNDDWHIAFADKDIDICLWQEIKNPDLVDYALVWKPEPFELGKFTNLKLIFSVGAGLDHLAGANILPPDIPVIRMVEDMLTAGMVEYVLYQLLRHHRFMSHYETCRSQKKWEAVLQTPAHGRSVGILGLGVLGQACAKAISMLGFPVAGWSRTPKSLPGVTSFHGDSQLDAFLQQSDVLICLLPLTDQTQGILNARNLAQLPRGAFLINAGRGGHQIETDILTALESGQLSGAALDVFETEPLPISSPLWDHPNVTITPHVASMTDPNSSAIHVYDNIKRYRAGQSLTHVADMSRGY